MIRIRFTLNQALTMVDCGLSDLGSDPSRSMLLTESDCETILRRVPRVGRTQKSICRKVAAALEAERKRRA